MSLIHRTIEEICTDFINESECKDETIRKLIKENEQLRKELQELKDKEDDRK